MNFIKASPTSLVSSPLVTRPLLAQVLDAACRKDLATFAGMCSQTLSPGRRYLPNWHIRAMAYHLEQVGRGKIRNLIINVPPRYFKSTLCSVAFPLFELGHDPSKRFMVVSYGSDLAVQLSNNRRTILNSSRYQRLFPGTHISGMKNTEFEFETTQHGGCIATTIEGSVTGRGGDIIIIDDPLKSSDAESENKRERVNDWFLKTLSLRLNDKQRGAIIVVMQRLHIEDLTGMLREHFPNQWTLLKLPAIAEEEERIQIDDDRYHVRHVGDVLHAEREPKWVLDLTRATMGPDGWAAQQQQSPLPAEGGIIKPNWVLRYDQLPARDSSSQIIVSVDTAFKEGGKHDFSALATFLLHDNKYYLIHMLRDRLNYPNLRELVIAHAEVHKPDILLIEDTGFGIGLIDELPKFRLSPIGVKPKHDKRTRVSIQSAKFRSGQVYFPRQAPWLPELEAEVFAFPHVRHDDQVDAICQALAHEISGYDYLLKNVGSYSEGSREAERIRQLNRQLLLQGRDLSQWPPGYDI